MALIQQSGDTELVNLLQGNTAGLGFTGPNMFNPDNALKITVLIPQQILVQQLGNSQELSKVSEQKTTIEKKLKFTINLFRIYVDTSYVFLFIRINYHLQQIQECNQTNSDHQVLLDHNFKNLHRM